MAYLVVSFGPIVYFVWVGAVGWASTTADTPVKRLFGIEKFAAADVELLFIRMAAYQSEW